MSSVSSLATVFALLTGIAGWFYLFYSKAAVHLGDIEQERFNRRRIRLRRGGGAAMLLLAVLFYAGFNSVDPSRTPEAFVAVWLGVCGLLLAIIILALLDVRLTWRLRQRRLRGDDPDAR